MTGRLAWVRDGRDWPNRDASRFVAAGGITWHVQVAGSGKVLLLVHGTGAATHSWRDLLPVLAPHFTVVAPDLPGHGFTEAPAPARLSLPGMAFGLAQLLRALALPPPALVAGHSAGAAILVRMCLDRRIAPGTVVSLNGALLPLPGLSEHVFSPIARLLAAVPPVPWLFARRAADPRVVARLLAGTGSSLDEEGVRLYRRLAGNPGHVAAALGMMAHWDLRPLAQQLPALGPHLVLVTGSNDRTVPPAEAARVRALLPRAEAVSLPGLGHLAHEERPAEVAALLLQRAPP